MGIWRGMERRAGVSIAGRYRLPEAWATARGERRRRRGTRFAPTPTATDGRAAALARLEAVLWIAREPLGSRRLAQLATLADGTQARTLVRMLNRHYDQHGCAFRAEEVAGGFRLMTRARFAPWLRRLHTEPVDVRLSAPALETLAVVAYRQPVLRADVEAVRGVQCGEILRQLIERDLVRVLRRSDELGRPLLYGTTKHFLQVFGLKNLDELPRPASLTPATNQQNAERSSDESENSHDRSAEDSEPSDNSNRSDVSTELNSQQGEEPEVNALVQPTNQSQPVDEKQLTQSQIAQADLPGGFDEEEEEFEDDFDEEFEDDDEEDDFDEDEDEDDDEDDWEEDDDFDDLEEDEEDELEEEDEDDDELEDEPWEEVEDDEEDEEEDELDEEEDDEDWEDEDDEDWDEDEDDWDEDDEDWDEDDDEEEEV